MFNHTHLVHVTADSQGGYFRANTISGQVAYAGVQRQVMTLSGCISYEQCPDGSEPVTWQCAYNSSGVPVEIEAAALLDALPSAKSGLCRQVLPPNYFSQHSSKWHPPALFVVREAEWPVAQTPELLQVGQSTVVCSTTVLTAQAFAAMTNGTCSPACPPSIPCRQVGVSSMSAAALAPCTSSSEKPCTHVLHEHASPLYCAAPPL